MATALKLRGVYRSQNEAFEKNAFSCVFSFVSYEVSSQFSNEGRLSKSVIPSCSSSLSTRSLSSSCVSLFSCFYPPPLPPSLSVFLLLLLLVSLPSTRPLLLLLLLLVH